MSTANAPNPMPQPMQAPSPTSPEPWYRPLSPYAKWGSLLLLFYLIGPVILYAKGTQKYAAGPSWQAEKRWAKVNGSTFLSLLWYVPIILFHAPLASFWTTLFITFAQWLHLPLLAWLGGTSLIPPLPSSTLLRWVLALPLAGLLAVCIEMMQPRTTWQTKRIVTPEEQHELDAIAATEEKKKVAQEKRKLRTAQQASTANNTTPPVQKQRKPRRPSKPKSSLIPPANSLWGNIDWSTVPETHPLKQAVREEAARLDAEQREEERKRWLAGQQASFQPTQPAPTAHQPLSPIIDSTLAPPDPPSPAPAPAPADAADDEYNWDEGEGSIQE
jgi:hypothetical protein